jgi:hypothetical protein
MMTLDFLAVAWLFPTGRSVQHSLIGVRSRFTQDSRPGAFSVVPAGLVSVALYTPGLTSWATFNRPFGTDRDTLLIADLFSASAAPVLRACPELVEGTTENAQA